MGYVSANSYKSKNEAQEQQLISTLGFPYCPSDSLKVQKGLKHFVKDGVFLGVGV